ncbi:MAG TPA: hypothetical protein PLO14_09045 [Accumulibacter sp.]|uniref:hypothetical protein n=1 Tax=Accumulibacter sp. TaxID=2053492 RepID=UPI0025FBBAC9|nr:hypothetical protein [Accumulibacter sp.]MCM8598461.1 hypothetical protein [Accumulibacter sp.]MCM8662550.1 hypothetical protein [Accumulibacter sp.]HNC52365.1 hypothetical protein [Accumulibacter sp.]
MKTDLTREQMMIVVERARHRRSLATGELYATAIRRTLRRLARVLDKFLHVLLMSPSRPR